MKRKRPSYYIQQQQMNNTNKEYKKQWINIVPECPLCKGAILSLVYNIQDETNTFTEYHLNPTTKKHHPPPLPRLNTQSQTLTTRWQHQRKLIYQQLSNNNNNSNHYHHISKVISYPNPLPRFHSFSVIQPQHIPKIIPFLQNELPILIGNAYDTFIEEHIKCILLIPYYNNIEKEKKKDHDKMTMYDDTIIQQLSEFIDENERVINRWMDELLAYLKSGLNYMTFINTAQYEPIDNENENEVAIIMDNDDDDDNSEDSDEVQEPTIMDDDETTIMNDEDDYDKHNDLSPSTSYISTSSTTSFPNL
ncbi:unnamed protein product [Cunninghamella blakesleeana]